MSVHIHNGTFGISTGIDTARVKIENGVFSDLTGASAKRLVIENGTFGKYTGLFANVMIVHGGDFARDPRTIHKEEREISKEVREMMKGLTREKGEKLQARMRRKIEKNILGVVKRYKAGGRVRYKVTGDSK